DGEVAALRAVFGEAVAGQGRGAFLAGAPGAGKSALANALRPVATERGGWFVAGKYDQYAMDAGDGGLTRALRRLGRMLLAEPDEQAARDRAELAAALGPNAGLIRSILPEFAALLGDAAREPPVD